MSDVAPALADALARIARGDPELVGVVGLSLRVSLAAAVIGFLLGAPLGALLAVARFRGRAGVVAALNALLGLPPVVVGLCVYLLLSRAGPLGPLGLLFTPAAMVIAQSLLALPIAAALAHRAVEGPWARYGDALLTDGCSRPRAVPVLLGIARAGLVTAFLAGFGRALSEVGAVIVVGGNVRGVTRSMTTAIALETSRGDLGLALALGVVLVTIALAVSALAVALNRGAAPDSV